MNAFKVKNGCCHIFASIVIFAAVGCGSTGPVGGPRVQTIAVTGTVMVDGAPAGFLEVKAISVGGAGAVPMDSKSITAGDGSFSLSTYESGDGVPVGSYKLTFIWGEMNLMNGQYSGDKLNGKYADPSMSEIEVTITADDKPHELGVIELTSN